MHDPVPPQARTELERLARRWQQLPLHRALRCAPAVREVAQGFADEVGARQRLPDLGPAAIIDQLVVTAYDLAAAGAGDGMAEQLAALRRRVG